MSPEPAFQSVHRVVRRRFRRLVTEDILALGFIILCIGTAIVAIIIAIAVSYGVLDLIVGGSIIGGLLGGDVLIGLAGAILRPTKQTATSVDAEETTPAE